MSRNGRSREEKRRKKQIREEEIKSKHKMPVGDWGQYTTKTSHQWVYQSHFSKAQSLGSGVRNTVTLIYL